MKRWLRREVLTPLLFLVLYGGALYLLTRKLQQLQILNQRGFMTWLLVASVLVYVILLVTTIRHITSVYLLQRFDPGDPRSIRRLARQRRFQLPSGWDGKAFLQDFPVVLHDADFEPESGEPRTGQVFSRSGIDFWTRRPVLDRVLLLETSSISVFRIDQLLKETVNRLDHVERPSRRNALVIVVRMPNKNDVASAAAGCVNYLGRFQSGTLFPILVDLTHKRMYYPINRSLISREHRGLYHHLLSLVRLAGQRGTDRIGQAKTENGQPDAGLKL